MPTISRFFGIAIEMFWREHNPPHFHATYAEDEAVFEIASLDRIRGHLPNGADLAPDAMEDAIRAAGRWVVP